MSWLMLRSFEDGKFWFNTLLREAFNFDEEVMWPNLEKVLRKTNLNSVGLPEEAEVDAFVDRKLKGLHQYKLDLELCRGSAAEVS